jgi:1-acyl-sn-glycerol-3-phosphate acyltransferase
MPDATQYPARNFRAFNRLLKMSIGTYLIRLYRIRVENPGLARLRAPFVLVANHVSVDDPFYIGSIVREPVWWITSDGNMRTRLMRFILSLVGSIPKAKAMPDLDTVKRIIEVVRKRRGVVGIFPEGQASWNGSALPLFASTAKLLKHLKVPVLAAVLKGGWSSFPRWAVARRRGALTVEFRLLFSPAELKALPSEEIESRLVAALGHDEGSWLRASGARFASARRAEWLETALYACPACLSIGSLRSAGSRLACSRCGLDLRLDGKMRFRADRGAGRGAEARAAPPFPTIPAWDAWQSAFLESRLEAARRQAASPGSGPAARAEPVFADEGVLVLKGWKMRPLRRLGRARLAQFHDRMEITGLPSGPVEIPVAEMEGVGVLKRALLEFYWKGSLWQFRFPSLSVSARKWLDAATILARLGSMPSTPGTRG